MDLTTILTSVGATLAMCGLLAFLAFWYTRRWLRATGLVPATPDVTAEVEATVDDLAPKACESCSTCSRFNLQAGQRLIESQPAFLAATAHLQPWQMSRQRKVEQNPEYLSIEADMLSAASSGDTERANELHEKLLTLDPGTVIEDESELDPALIDTAWADAGLCGVHREIRFASDHCDRWTA